jgi:adsorption protein B
VFTPFAHLVTESWAGLQILLMIAAVVIFVSSAEDMLLDLSYWAIMLFLPFDRLRQPSSKTVRKYPERLAALMIPAWREAGVIGRMLRNTMENMEYERFHVFVGVYPNDPETCDEVMAVSAQFANVHCVIVDRPGPTKKSDCLNQIVREVLSFEKQAGQSFELFVNHDAEDVVHAFELKAANWFLQENGMIQFPVISLDRNPLALVACHYMDEFAEWHTKDLVVRSALSGMTPSAGVGTAFGRLAIDALLKARNNALFNPDSLTEDYDIAQFLLHLGFRSQFIRYRARMAYTHITAVLGREVVRKRRELVATREYFPHKFQAAIRQKARWVLGISLQGWQQIGWQGNWIDRYFLWRDRKQLFTAPAVIAAYAVLVAVAALWLAAATLPGFPVLPPLVRQAWLSDLILINLGFLLNRLAHRAIFVWHVHGFRYVPLSPIRAIVANWIGFFAFVRALRQFLHSSVTGKSVAWDKTVHAFPLFPRRARSRPGRNRGDDRSERETRNNPSAKPQKDRRSGKS